MKLSGINIRDPFILPCDGKYYLYGTRANNFGVGTMGFDVYISDDLQSWSPPAECFNSAKFGLGSGPNWAPEVHCYSGKYYMFATFEQKNGLRGTFSCVAERPEGPFVLNSEKALTPEEWECLDGTLYISKDGVPYLVFCHEHTQIIDGEICRVRLNEGLAAADGLPEILFRGSDPFYIVRSEDPGKHYITDGPFLFRNSKDELLMLWSTFVDGKYAQCIAKSDNGEIDGTFVHLTPLCTDDSGHGMIFEDRGAKKFVMHSPNICGIERPVIFSVKETGESIIIF